MEARLDERTVNAAPWLSVVIPYWDEAESLAQLHAELSEVLDALGCESDRLNV